MQEALAPATVSFRCSWHAGKSGVARHPFCSLQDFLCGQPDYMSRVCMWRGFQQDGCERGPIFLGSLYLSVNTQHMWIWHGTQVPRATELNCAFYILRIALFIFHESYLLVTSYFWASVTCNSLVIQKVTEPTSQCLLYLAISRSWCYLASAMGYATWLRTFLLSLFLWSALAILSW